MGGMKLYEDVLTKEYLTQEYVVNEKSQEEIAREIDVSHETIRSYLKYHGISTRSVLEAQLLHYAKARNPINPLIILDYMDGLMLSDGHLTYTGYTSAYQQPCKHKDWLDCIQVVFEAASMESTVKSYEACDTRFGRTIHRSSYLLCTKSYPELVEQQQRWYPEGVKVIPEDIRLTPECLANEYMGDGHLEKDGRVNLATDGFTSEEVNFLSDYLNAMLDIESTIQKCYGVHYRIYIPKRYTHTLFEYIEPYILECYAYKLGEYRRME